MRMGSSALVAPLSGARSAVQDPPVARRDAWNAADPGRAALDTAQVPRLAAAVNTGTPGSPNISTSPLGVGVGRTKACV